MLKHTSPLSTQSYAKTLRLPRSAFPPRPDVTLRPTLLQQCTGDLYQWQAINRPASHPFVLHDGPPYANGPLHIGHALNKVLKDVFNRFQGSQGKRVHYRPGWDCHGLPIELKALQASQSSTTDAKPRDAVAVREAARDLARRAIEEQMAGFKSWGVMGDWDNAYKTMDAGFEIKQLEVFRGMVEQGLIHRHFKPVYWSPSSRTALAEAELEYDERHVSLAAYVKYELVDVPVALRDLQEQGRLSVLIWTTTPWTLPANKAIAFHNELEYSIIKAAGDLSIVASSRVQEVAKAKGLALADLRVVKEGLKGTDLGTGTYRNPLQGQAARPQPLIHADFVSADSGSGLVHLAPGHGLDDYNVCQSAGLDDTFAPVDDAGCFTEAAMPEDPATLSGKAVLEDGSRAVLSLLGSSQGDIDNNNVWTSHPYTHKYPIDWRTKLPVIIRATAQWFADVDQIKDQAMSALDDVKFTPRSGKSRLQSFIAGRSQWCISRQRAWGVPIPALFRVHEEGKQEAVMTSQSVSHIIGVIKERGIDSWWTDAADDPCWAAPGLPPGQYVRGKDTMDVWFDSGTTWTQLPDPSGSEPRADVYIEGTDQHRGWFQSSLLTRVAHLASTPTTSKVAQAPFKRLITHGFILDQDARKMSKSLGNVVNPLQIMDGTLLPPLKPGKKSKQKKQHSVKAPASTVPGPQFDAMGPDALRLWATSNDYTHDVLVGTPVLAAVNTSLHKYRVTLKWLLGVSSDYTATIASISTASLSQSLDLSDRLALHHLAQTTKAVHSAYATFEPYKVTKALDRYIVQDLSAFYFETAKDVLYTAPLHDRIRVQAVCYEILRSLLAMLAAIMPLLVAESLHYAEPGLRECLRQRCHDPFRDTWSPMSAIDMTPANETTCTNTHDTSIEVQATTLANIRAAVREAQERARSTAGRLGSGLDSNVMIVMPPEIRQTTAAVPAFLRYVGMNEELARALVVSEVQVVLGNIEGVEGNGEAIKHDELVQRGPPPEWIFAKQFDIALPDVAAKATQSEAGAGLKGMVLVMPPRSAKCPRCWRYVIEQQSQALGESAQGSDGKDEVTDEVCGRCAKALDEVEI